MSVSKYQQERYLEMSMIPRFFIGRVVIGCVAVILGCAVSVAHAIPPGLDERIESLLQSSGLPGMSLAIVEDGQVVMAKGYGVRKLGAPDKVTSHTIFPIGSTTKAITAAALAVLVDRGRIGWDDRVIDRLPWFQMYDAYATREMTIRDLLIHRSGLGLGAGDLLFMPRSNLSRAESVRRLRYIKPATSFRSGYAYDNVLYMVAGQLIEEVTGQSWEDFVRENVLKPAGMSDSTTRDSDRFRHTDRAFPHGRINGPIMGLGDMELFNERDGFGANVAPAGNVSSSATDLARWISIQLNGGKLPQGPGRLFSASAAREMWTPQTLVPIRDLPAALAATAPQFQSYALGWEVRDWHGHKIVWHSGVGIGFGSMVVLMPEKNSGFAILANAVEGVPVRGLMYELLDHYLDQPKSDWPATLASVQQAQIAVTLKAVSAERVDRAKVGPSLPIASYAGDYVDAWYGPIAIKLENGQLMIDFKQTPGMVGALEHWQYDTFRVRWQDRGIEPAYLTFALTAEGAIEKITMKAVSPLADFSFDYHDLRFTPAVAQSAGVRAN